MRLFFTEYKLNLNAIFDTAGRRISSLFFSDEQYWDLICVKAENVLISGIEWQKNI